MKGEPTPRTRSKSRGSVSMSESCPYCGEELADLSLLGRHAMTQHTDAVRAHYVREGYVSRFVTGQQRLQEVVV